MVGTIFESKDKRHLLDRQSRLWVSKSLLNHVLQSNESHRFLDNVTTDIIHYETKKVSAVSINSLFSSLNFHQLVYYPGNLSSFVASHPEAKSYYTLAATSVKFSFPPPGSLMGVRSNTRAILKLSNCTFTYPGRKVPSLYNVSCALSLSR